jgi:hypothetical protein
MSEYYVGVLCRSIMSDYYVGVLCRSIGQSEYMKTNSLCQEKFLFRCIQLDKNSIFAYEEVA